MWLALAIALALPQLPPIAWPLLVAALFLTRPALGQACLVVILCLRLPAALPVLQGWVERCRVRRQAPIQVYPDRLSGDRPQTLTLYAPRSRQLQVHWQGNQLAMAVESLGHGVFRLPVQGGQARPGSALQVESDGDGSCLLPLHWLAEGPRPGPISTRPGDGVAAVVSESSDEVLLVDRQKGLRRLACGDGPSACQWLGSQRLLIGTRYSQDLELMEIPSGQIRARLAAGGPVENLAVSEDGRWLAVLVGQSVQLRRLPQLGLESQVELPAAGEYLVFSGPALVVSSRTGRSLYRLDLDKRDHWSLHATPRSLARPALGLCRGAHAGEVWLASTSGQLHGGHQKGNHYVLNCLLRLDVSDWTLAYAQSTESRTARQEGPGAINSGCGPEGLCLDEAGRMLLVYSGTHEVGRRDLLSGEEKRYGLAAQGLLEPRYVGDLGAGWWLLSFPAQHSLVWMKEGQVEHKLQLQPSDLKDEGEIDFYESTLSGISCQSCHTRADSDYARHDIGGFAAWGTLSCQGIQDTAPYLRNGSYPRLQDLHSVASGLYRNYERATPVERPEALKAYLESLLLPENPQVADLEQRRRGCEVFFASGCAECHRPPAFTNRASLPNQNLFPGQVEFEWLDVPSLHGLWRSAPYLHDGRAATLRNVLEEENQADRHGATQTLGSTQKADLEAFLRCL